MARTISINFFGDDKALSKTLDHAASGVDKVEKAFDKLDTIMGTAGIAGAAAFAGALNEGLDVTAARGKLQAQLGLTQADSQRVGKVAGDLFANAYGDSMDNVSESITAVIQNMGGMRTASSAALKETTAQAITAGQVLGEDVGATTRAVAQMMRTGLAKSSKEAFDILVAGAQHGANKSQDLLDTFNEYGTQFRKLGLSGQTAMGIISQGLQGGARDADIVADSIKEFSIRAVDGSKLTAQGFTAIGLNAKTMAEQIGHGGKPAAAALDVVLDRLRRMKDPVKQASAATALFGTQAEDMGAALFKLDPSSATKALGGFKGATDAAGKAMGDTAASKFTAWKRSIQTDLINVMVDKVIPLLITFQDRMKSLGISPSGLVAAGIAVTGLAVAFKGVRAAIGGVRLVAGGVMKTISISQGAVAGVRAAGGAWDALRLRAMYAADASRSAGSAVLSAGKSALVTAGNVAKLAAGYLWMGLKAAGSAIAVVATKVAETAVSVATRIWAAAQWLLNAAWDASPIGVIVLAIAALVAVVIYAYTHFTWFKNAVDAAWAGIKNAATSAWVQMQPVFTTIRWWIVNILIRYYKLLWAGVQLAWRGIVAAIAWAWPLIKLYWAGVKLYISVLVLAFKGLWAYVKFAWSVIATEIRIAWAIIKPVWNLLKWYITSVLIPQFKLMWSTAKTVWSGVHSAISNAWNSIRSVFNTLKSGVHAVQTAFSVAVSAIRKIWDGLKSATRGPVSFVVNTVYMGGIRRVWEGVRSLVPALPQLPSIKFASGGILPGYSPGRDSVLAMLSPGEGILRPEAVRALGEDFVHRANAGARKGGAGAVAKALGGYGDPGGLGLPGFADGGIVGTIKGILKNPANAIKNVAGSIMTKGVDVFAGAILNPILSQAGGGPGLWGRALGALPRLMINGFLSFIKNVIKPNLSGGGSSAAVAAARSQIGVPYSWGGGGLGGPSRGFAQGANTVGFDCSSLMEYAWGRASGGKDITRTTYSQRRFLRTIGSPVPGAVGQPHPGHTYMYAGNGRIIEAAHTGTNVRETSVRGGEWWGLPPWKFDRGGMLQPGVTLAVNNTGRPEPVFPSSEAAAAYGSGKTVNVMPNSTLVVKESADVDQVMQRADFLSRALSF